MTATSASGSSRRPTLLQQIEIATPCHARWEDMHGSDNMRFCNQCSLHVYNLSAMTEDAAEKLILSREGRLCVRLYKRADGTVITEDCPKGLEKAARRMRMIMGAAASALAAFLGADLFRPAQQCSTPLMGAPPVRGAVHVGPPPVPPPVQGRMVAPHAPVTMGEPAPLSPKMGKMARPVERPQTLMGDVAAPPK